jgi:hypothetical protein
MFDQILPTLFSNLTNYCQVPSATLTNFNQIFFIKRFIAGKNSEFVLKWQKSKKLVIEKDDTDEYLSKYLKAIACVALDVAMNGCENEFACVDQQQWRRRSCG